MSENIEETEVTTGKISMKYGLISGLIGITFFIVINLLGQGMNQSLSYINYLILAIIIYLAHKTFKEEGDGFMNYGQGLGIGTLLTLISSILSSIFFYIYVSYINSEYIQQVLDMTRQKMEEDGTPDGQIDQAMEITEKMMTPVIMPIIGLVMTVFFGFLISLIVSAITQKKRPENELL
ncbi:MAG: DUF4199 domain-containing protein [Cytophagales bacterium]|nr:DUF4199 domain-containing protein [Cytophagales bacterium]